MNLWAIILTILALVVVIFIVVYAIKNKGKEVFLLLGICFLIPAIIFTIELLFADFPISKISITSKVLLTFAIIWGLFFSISHFVKHFRNRIRLVVYRKNLQNGFIFL
ncbi:MAG: hypothetical protein KAJ66_03285 [Candidatus Omnitrophica bacterium]|nr:hypothetical protein [Candidatus Omnitrophota bacterium]